MHANCDPMHCMAYLSVLVGLFLTHAPLILISCTVWLISVYWWGYFWQAEAKEQLLRSEVIHCGYQYSIYEVSQWITMCIKYARWTRRRRRCSGCTGW
jgi:hypothetical protein